MPQNTRRRAVHYPTTVMSWYMVVFAVIIGWLQAMYTHGRLLPDDWASLWIAGQLHRDGLDSELYLRDPQDFAYPAGEAWAEYGSQLDNVLVPHPFVHNPLVAHWMSGWVSIQDFTASVYTLTWISGVALVVLIASAYFVWFQRQISFPLLAGITVLMLANPMYQNGIWLGQTSALIYALVFLGLALSKTERWWIAIPAGLLLAFAGFIKITPLLLIPVLLLFPRHRKAGIAATISVGFFFLWSFVVVSGEVVQTWWQNLQDLNGSVLLNANNQSLPAWFLDQEQSGEYVVEVLNDAPTWATLVPVLIAVFIGVLFLVLALLDRELAFPLLTVGGFTLATLFGRIVWTHYYIVLIGIVLGILALGAHRQYIMVLTACACFLFYPPIGVSIGSYGEFGLPYHGVLAGLILLGIFILALVEHVLELHRSSRLRWDFWWKPAVPLRSYQGSLQR